MSIRVLLVDDSFFMRKLVSDIIKKDQELEVIGVAKNGKEAIELNRSLQPDVILLDVEMPVVDGLEALEQIMAQRRCPVIMFSSTTVSGAENTVRALELGACDFIPKPSSSTFKLEDEVVDEIIAKLKFSRCTEAPSIRKKASTAPARSPVPSARRTGSSYGKKTFKKLVSIGISTGGPKALQEVMEDLPGDLNAPILVVQHMPKLFTKAFADRLDTHCEIRVKEAEHGDVLEAGTVYIAPGDKHLRIKESPGELKILLDEGEKVSGHRPSADAMFESLLEVKSVQIVAVIMTGMGRDGAEGMLKLRKKGAKTIGQDEKTSVVYGMPKSAFELGAVEVVCPLNKIADEIIRSVEE